MVSLVPPRSKYKPAPAEVTDARVAELAELRATVERCNTRLSNYFSQMGEIWLLDPDHPVRRAVLSEIDFLERERSVACARLASLAKPPNMRQQVLDSEHNREVL